MAIDYVVVPSGTGDVQAIQPNNFLRLCGWSVSEDAGSTAQVVIRDGTSASGNPLVAPINCAPNGFGMWFTSGQGIPCSRGLFVDRISGQTTVVLYFDIL